MSPKFPEESLGKGLDMPAARQLNYAPEVPHMRSVLAVILITLLTFPAGVVAAASSGLVHGRVTLAGRPLSGLELSLVNVSSGAVHKARSGAQGDFELSLDAGRYVITGPTRAGLAVGRAPTLVTVEPGKVASLDLEFVAVAVPALQEAEGQGANINHEAVGCLIAGEFPILDAVIEPASSVVRARIYFQSVLSEEWYFVEMQQVETGFRGWLPRPQLAASPITYYIQMTTTDFGEGRIADVLAKVVEFEDECGDAKLAAFGDPPAALTIYSASTGAAAALPVGFAAGGLALGAGAIALIVVGAGAAVAGGVAAAGGDDPTTTTTTATTTATTSPTTTPTTTIPPEDLFSLTLQPLGAADGRIDVFPAPGPTGEYRRNTGITLEAVPGGVESGSPSLESCFTGWGDDCAFAATNRVCNLLMDSDKTVSYTFRLVPAGSCKF
jgi:hypothetical protein